jgi:transcriptional regulator with XRE-family HTH domain
MDTKELAHALREARERRGMTQKEAALKMGCHQNFIQRIESNVGDRQSSQMFRYAEALGVQIGWYILDPLKEKEVTGL